MKGTSLPDARTISSAASPSKPGIAKSEITTWGGPARQRRAQPGLGVDALVLDREPGLVEGGERQLDVGLRIFDKQDADPLHDRSRVTEGRKSRASQATPTCGSYRQ